MTMRGADAVVRALAAAGVDRIFGVSGNHVMSVFDAMIGQPVSLVHARHEAAAVYMADAYARVAGTVGVALVTGGPGHANAIGALCTAMAGETPLVLLAGHAPLVECGFGAFQEIDQAEMAAPVTKASWTAQSAAKLPEDIAAAFRVARSGRPGPVHVSLPSDVLNAVVGDDIGPCVDGTLATLRLAPEDATEIVRRLRQARRPIVIVPPALCMPSNRATLGALQDWGVPVVPMQSPRGVNDPMLGDLPILLKQADCIFLLGKKLDFTLDFGNAAGRDCRWIVIQPDEVALRHAASLLDGSALSVQADVLPAIEALAAAAPMAAEFCWSEFAAMALARRQHRRTDTLDSATLCLALESFMRKLDDPIFVSDGGEFGQWAQAFITAPDRLINGVGGAIGVGLPFAIGAKAAAAQRPVLAVMGDGSFGFHMAEFETAVRHGLPFVAVIGNDGRWNAEYQIQLRSYGMDRAFGCEMGDAVRYDRVAEALGGRGILVDRLTDVEPALWEALSSQRPACVNVLLEGLPAPRVQSGEGSDNTSLRCG